MATLTKNDLIDGARCARRLWLRHQPQDPHKATTTDDEAGLALARIDLDGLQQAAQQIYGAGSASGAPAGRNPADRALQALLVRRMPIHGAWVEAAGVGVRCDFLLPRPRKAGWRLVHLARSSKVEDRHLVEVAIRVAVARAAGIDLRQAAVALVDSTWQRAEGQSFNGLLREVDVTADAERQVDWALGSIKVARAILRRRREPEATMGPQCQERGRACTFVAHCGAAAPEVEHPVQWIPKWSYAARRFESRRQKPPLEMRDVADSDLTPAQRRAKSATLSGEPFFDSAAAAAALPRGWPKVFLDFETISPLVPLWPGWRARETAAFQFSVHRLGPRGRINHEAFLSLSGDDPTGDLARALLQACGTNGPIHVYYAAVERGVIESLARRHPHLAPQLSALVPRLFDLLPVAQAHWYHPAQQGSFSLKAVLPTVAPQLAYANLPGVRDGLAASLAWWQAWAPDGEAARTDRLRRELLAYCERDTLGLVRLWQHLAGRNKG